ncbi:MAG: PQQ-dependent sugar dehydrogenase [Longimicrobiales bacterium]
MIASRTAKSSRRRLVSALSAASTVLMVGWGFLLLPAEAAAQRTDEPFPDPIPETEGAIVVNFTEFATVPDFEGGPPRMMELRGEPGTDRLFVNDMWGVLYSVSHDGGTVTEYVDLTDSRWGVDVEARGSERGFQNFALHPQFAEEGTPGYGKFYTYVDVSDTGPEADFTTRHDQVSHHTVVHEWTAESAGAARYDGEPPREVMRFAQPYGNHNAGELGFNPRATPGDEDFGMLYMGVADGGSGGDPMDLAQDMTSAFGKIFRIDPLGSDSDNGKYGIPSDNPFVGEGDALPEIYAYGVRNPQRFDWDPDNGNLFLADIGQNIVEELTLVPEGADLGWNDWEGSFEFISRQAVDVSNPRGDPSVTYPVAEYGHGDPVLLPGGRAAVTGVHVYRSDEIPELRGRVIFGDNPSGEIFHISADDLPDGGEDSIRRILLNDGGEEKTLLELVQEKTREQGREVPDQADLRFGSDSEGRLYLLNKFDGTIRLLVP